MTRGGKRPGAGRPKVQKTADFEHAGDAGESGRAERKALRLNFRTIKREIKNNQTIKEIKQPPAEAPAQARGGRRSGAGRPKQKPLISVTPAPVVPVTDAAPSPSKTPAPESKKIKRGPPPRGGKRPGAGRRKVADPVEVVPASPAEPDKHSTGMRRRVALCASANMDVPSIAIALDIDEAILRLDFARELANGSAIVRADNLAALSAAADEGNAAAAKALLAIADKATPSAPPAARGLAAAGGDAVTRALKLVRK